VYQTFERLRIIPIVSCADFLKRCCNCWNRCRDSLILKWQYDILLMTSYRW